MSAKENNSDVAVEKGTEEKPAADKCDLKGTKRPSEEKTPEAKKYRKEENGGGGDAERLVDFPEDEEEPDIDEEDEEDDMGDGEEDDLDGEDEELEEEDMGAEEEDEEA